MSIFSYKPNGFRALVFGCLFLPLCGCHLFLPAQSMRIDHQNQTVSKELPAEVEPQQAVWEPPQQPQARIDDETVPPKPRPTGMVGRESSMEESSDDDVCTLETLAGLAFAVNPTIQKIEREIESLRGKRHQAGLYPNPTTGVFGDDINDGGAAGRYGVFYSQKVVRSNRLCLARNTIAAEIKVREIELAESQQRLATDVKLRFYALLVAQAKAEVADQLFQVSQQGVNATRQLVNAKEVATTTLTQAELEFEKAKLNVKQVANELTAAKGNLRLLLGDTDLPLDDVVGDLNQVEDVAQFEAKFEQLVSQSPELSKMYAEVDVAKRNLRHQCSLRVPDITWQAGLAYDFNSDAIVPNFQIGIPIQKYNRNQGAIAQAKHLIAAHGFAAEQKVTELRQRLVESYRIYQDAKIQVVGLRDGILPKARKNLELLSAGFEQGEVAFLDLLTAQRSYFQFNLSYVKQLQILWEHKVMIEGLLLFGNLTDDTTK